MMKRRYSIGTLTTVARQIVVAPPNKTITIDSIYLANFSGANSNFDVYHVPAGEVVADHFHLIHLTQIRPTTAVNYIDPRIYLEPGDGLWMLASDAGAVTATIYGTES
jgi:hypothetical protein